MQEHIVFQVLILWHRLQTGSWNCNRVVVSCKVMIAQYVGAGKEKEIHKTIETTFTLVIILAVIMTIGMQIFMNPILHILQTPLESYQEASNYYRVVISGILFTFMYNAIANILRGMGDGKKMAVHDLKNT